MSDSLLRRESAVEFFKELVDGALMHQRLTANELTAFYVVQLLARFVDRGAGDNQPDAPLAVRLAHALEEGGARQRSSLKDIGDRSLFISGFFSDSSIALVVARRNLRTRSGLSLSVAVLAMMPELIRLTP